MVLAGIDFDGDAKDDGIAFESTVATTGIEAVTVPAGTYPDALRVREQVRVHYILSGGAAVPPVTYVSDRWFVATVGLVKQEDREEGELVATTELLSPPTLASADAAAPAVQRQSARRLAPWLKRALGANPTR
jgi:hypothetical protein